MATSPHAVQIHPHIAEVDLRFRSRGVLLRHGCLHRGIAGLNRDRSPAGFDVLADLRIRNDRLVFIHQTVKNPVSGMALFPGSVQISEQHRVNGSLQRIQLRGPPRRRPPLRRFRRRQRLTDRSSRDIVRPGQSPDRQPTHACVPADPREHCLPLVEKHSDGTNGGWAQTKLRLINRRAVKPCEVGSSQTAKPVSTQTAMITTGSSTRSVVRSLRVLTSTSALAVRSITAERAGDVVQGRRAQGRKERLQGCRVQVYEFTRYTEPSAEAARDSSR